MNYPAFSFLIIWVIVSSMSNIQCQPLKSNQEEQIDQLFDELNSTEVPGAAVGVVKDGELIFKKGYGIANLDYGIPISPESVFDIASVSKQFCAFSIAMLIEDGTLSLDDNIRKYIQEVPDFGTDITIRHLVHHLSGIRDWPMTLAIGGWQFDEVISMDQILRMVETQQDLNFTPGDEHMYSNTGYNLLAEIISRVTGKSFREWTDEHLFGPLGMNDTHFHDDHNEIVPRRVQGYFKKDEDYKMMTNNLMALGSSSLYTTVEDLSRWTINFETGEVGGSKVLDLVHQKGVLNNGDTISYAFGQSIDKYKGFTRVAHSGSWAGFRTYLVRFPEQSLSVIVLSNNGSFKSGRKALSVADIFLFTDQPKESSKEQKNVPHYVKAIIDPEVFDDYVGDYELMPGFNLSFFRKGNQFFTQATGQSEFELTASSDSTFFIEQFAASVTFHRDPDGNVNTLTLNQNGIQKAKRIEPFNPAIDDLKEIAGLYYSPELKTFYEIKLEKEHLTGIHQRLGKMPMQLVGPNILSSGVINPINIIRNKEGQIIRLELGQGRVRNVRLERIEKGEFEKY